MLQGVINRLAGNSFLLKGWSVTLVSAVLVLSTNLADAPLIGVALLPVLTFWGLDDYSLAQERLYRGLYERGHRRRQDGCRLFDTDRAADLGVLVTHDLERNPALLL